jgi:hypothetical protein
MSIGRGLVIVLAWLALLTGCATDGSILHPMPDQMSGLFLEISVEKPPDSFALYSVKKDGTISFGGGKEARQGETTWTDELSDEERVKIVAMVEQFGWLHSGPVSSKTNPEHEYAVSARRGSTRMSVEVTGDNPQVVEMVSYLDQICRRRFDAFIESLPQPGQAPPR